MQKVNQTYKIAPADRLASVSAVSYTHLASFDYKNESFVFINEGFVYKNGTCVYRLIPIRKKFNPYPCLLYTSPL